MSIHAMWTPQLGRNVYVRPGTSDMQTWRDTFGGAGQYHVPPSEMPAPATVLDLGANIGLTAAHYQAMWPRARVVGVEMDAANVALAKQNAPGVEFIHAAVAAGPGTGFYDPGVAAEAYRLRGEGGLDDTEGLVAVECRPIEDLLSVFGDYGADFVKMDVEGMEWPVFAQPTHHWVPLARHLLIELHPWGGLPDDSGELLNEMIFLLEAASYVARHHVAHPRAVWARYEV